MSDLRTLLRSVDEVRAPDLWAEIQARALAPAPAPSAPRRRLVPRLVPVAAALVAIVVAFVTLVPRPPSAFAIVRDAIEDFASIPPFRATIVGPNAPGLVGPSAAGSAATLKLWYRDANAWRVELVDIAPPSPRDSVGSYDVWDGKSLFSYEAASNTYSMSSNIGAGFSPLGFLNWDRGGGITFWQERCGSAASEVLPDEAVAGRAARHVRCGELELWIDTETGLMLRIRSNQVPSAAPEPFPGPIGLLPGTSVEITSIEYDPVFPEGTFSFTPPPGAKQGEPSEEEQEEPPPPLIRPGSLAPSWRLPLLAGGELGTADLRGKQSAIYFWATWCAVCAGGRLDALQASYEAYGDRINVVSVAVNDERLALEDTIARGRYGFPVVLDDEPALGMIGRLWGVWSIPSLVLLDAEGRVVAVVTERGITADELKDYLEAFAHGRPLPSPDRG